ncbi:mitochondrial intermembrane space import and assembly protein 40-B-like [Branchiostoma lanceolatum]|uniref:mitochondrial intermembrane space import and assembly protein 40-B-like n=1 Tax=Branchiostoma lanceolatum TaxID=7740 RepID=UPI0034527C2E
MSYCREQGKDKIIFVTKEDHETPSTADITYNAEEDDDSPGLILPNGEINWQCPCLGGMASGPCGEPFKEAFSCFHYSPAEPKGSDCIEEFRNMQECMSKYPELYPYDKDEENDKGVDEQTKTTTTTVEEKTSEEVAVSKESAATRAS